LRPNLELRKAAELCDAALDQAKLLRRVRDRGRKRPVSKSDQGEIQPDEEMRSPQLPGG
jgi:hypothetical protein